MEARGKEMGKTRNNKVTIGEFITHLQNEYKGNISIDRGTVYALVERGLIPPKKVRNYTMIKDFDSYLKTNNGNVNITALDMAEKYSLELRQTYNIIYSDRPKHFPKNNVED